METVWETGNNEKTGKHAAVERRYGMSLRKFKIKIEGKNKWKTLIENAGKRDHFA